MIDHIHALPEGYQLQEYTITGVLGFGGFGISYSAQDQNLDKVVAIKEYLPGELAARVDGQTVSAKSERDRDSYDWGLERFMDEARAVAKFNHPNIIRVHRFFQQNGTAYMVMEYIEGRTLASELKQHGTLPEAEIRRWLWPIMDGLKVVHAAGYVHRDIKPQNVLMGADGIPILIDFGAARVAFGGKTRSLTSIMTPGYAPLEQYESRGNQGPWTDIYALGAVMYCCVSGKKPPDAFDRIRRDPLNPLGMNPGRVYSEGLISGILAALAVAESDRPQDIQSWLMLLDATEQDATRMMPDSRPDTVRDGGLETSSTPSADATPAPRNPFRPVPWLFALVPILVFIGAAGYWYFNPGLVGDEPLLDTTIDTEARQAAEAPKEPEPTPKADERLPPAGEQPMVVANEGQEVISTPPGANNSMDGEARFTDSDRSLRIKLEERLEPGEVFRDCGVCPEVVVIPAGSFLMGSPAGEKDRDKDEGPQHRVTIAKPFAIGRYEVTFEEYAAFARTTGRNLPDDSGWGGGRRPVINVSWSDAAAYTEWLSQRTGARYRLPSEAEWEYAARAGSTSAFWWGHSIGRNRAVCDGCESRWDNRQTAPVGSFQANPFGLFDVHGNVWEWVQDCWNYSYRDAPADGSAAARGECAHRVLRGGSWGDLPRVVRIANRFRGGMTYRRNHYGFRLARTLE